METLYPYLDTIYFDIKIIDSIAHKKYCGVPNEKILDNFIQLSSITVKDGKILLPRVPLIPDITDTEVNIRGIASFLKKLNIEDAALLAYNPLYGTKKSDKVGVDDPYKSSKVMTSFTDKIHRRKMQVHIHGCRNKRSWKLIYYKNKI